MNKVRISLDRPTGNFWIDNGLVVLYDLFGEGEFEVDDLVNRLVNYLVVETGNVGEYYDEKEGKVKEYKKKNWRYPCNLFINVSPRSPKKTIAGKTYQLTPPQYFLRLEFRSESELCDVCGGAGKTTDAKMWMFPFIVARDKFSNFYSGLRGKTRFCPRCAIAGLAGYLGWLWKIQDNSLHIFIFYADLETMFNLRKYVFNPMMYESEARGGNVRLEFSGRYIHETTMGLLLWLFKELRARHGAFQGEVDEILEEIFGQSVEGKSLTLFAFSGNSKGSFRMEAIEEFSNFKPLYSLYLKWIDLFSGYEGNAHELVRDVFEQFYFYQRKTNGRKNSYHKETIWRDKISWAVLELTDPLMYVEDFLYSVKTKAESVGGLRFGTLEVFGLYCKEVLKMDESLLEEVRKFGYSLGYRSRERNEMGLLYSLRNAKSLDEFFKVLNDVQFKLELSVPDNLVRVEKGERICGSPWLRVKTLLSIYSMNAYLNSKGKSEN